MGIFDKLKGLFKKKEDSLLEKELKEEKIRPEPEPEPE